MNKCDYGLYMYGITNAETVGVASELVGINQTQGLTALPVAGFSVFVSYVDLCEYGTGVIDTHLQDMQWVK